MYLKIKGGPFSNNLFKEIETITDRATLFCQSFLYEKDKGLITFDIVRYPIKKKRKLLGSITPYSRNMNIKVKSKITIKNVMSSKITDNLSPTDKQEITLLFGLTVEDNTILISSAEESRGKQLFSAILEISELDLEISD